AAAGPGDVEHRAAGPQHVDHVLADAGVDRRGPDPREVLVVAVEGVEDGEGVAAEAAVDVQAAHVGGVVGHRGRGQGGGAGGGADAVAGVCRHVPGGGIGGVVDGDVAGVVAVEVDHGHRRQDALRAARLAEVEVADVELAVDRHRLDRGLDVDRVEVAD